MCVEKFYINIASWTNKYSAFLGGQLEDYESPYDLKLEEEDFLHMKEFGPFFLRDGNQLNFVLKHIWYLIFRD